MTTTKIYSKENLPQKTERTTIIKFLHNHLDQYGDAEQDIEKAVSYALGENGKPGGLIITAKHESSENISGVCVINKTGMSGYIPENILVYIATDRQVRGKGIGKRILQTSIESTEGDIALHCEPDNPAKFLYEKIGFQSKYLEMRLKK
ncbi:GNAT family N-acetyltransferase [Chryseobacterium arthrosphaerae]|uniref:GNAT family N-acetyltransferase n=1 Tax=Chryseobacterium TaxID=59732 RepID=UPI0023E2C9A7|nr:GNAT family N-acetyltransferase [Chryseobacterium arthrosphaerae]WES98184.1 GNAT family N-acetyltransferase [Chryseobacterium arthrosphaerae]